MQVNQYDFTKEKIIMHEILEKVTVYFDKQLPFVVYATPNSEELKAFFQLDDTLELFKEQSGFVFAPFNSDEKYCIAADNSSCFTNAIHSSQIQNFTQTTIPDDEKEKSNFEVLVENAVASIQRKTFDKVVLSRKVPVAISLDIVATFQNLLANYTAAFRYLFYHPKIGTWMGATPEQLVKIEEKTLTTVALAGTQLFTPTLIWKEKERKEQQFVTDFISSELKQFSNNIIISKPETVKAGLLAHIKTSLTATLNETVSIPDLLNTLHPTPAVCGLPKKIALDYIIANENYDRKFYTGFLGTYNVNKVTNLFVNLRCMEIEEDGINLYVGCGITKDSNAAKEYIETQNKMGTMLKILKSK